MSDINNTLTDFVPQDVKIANIRTNLVPGYPSSRWSPKLPWGSPTQYALAGTVVEVRNLSETDAVLKFQETDNDASSGERTDLGTAIAVRAGGTKLAAIWPTHRFVEVKGIAGNGLVGIELQTKIEWINVGLGNKNDPTYPEILYAADPAVPVASAQQDFTSNTVWTVVHNLGFVAEPTLIDEQFDDITYLATISAETVNGYVATFSSARAGTAYSTQ